MPPPTPRDKRYERVPIDSIQPFPGNPRVGHRPTLDASLNEHDQFDDLIVQESTGYIIAGNNTWHAMKDAHATEVDVAYLDVTDEQAIRMNLVHNRAGDKSTYDERLLVEFLTDLPDLDGTGYDPGDLDDLRAELDENTSPDDPLSTDSNTQTYPSLDDTAANYALSDQRQIVLAYAGEQYVWVVETLSALSRTYGTDSNATTLLKLIEQATGEPAPEVTA